jgi:hypothetical protein
MTKGDTFGPRLGTGATALVEPRSSSIEMVTVGPACCSHRGARGVVGDDSGTGAVLDLSGVESAVLASSGGEEIGNVERDLGPFLIAHRLLLPSIC